FVVLSVFSGLKDYSLSFVKGYDPDLRIVSTVGKTLDLTLDREQKIKQIDGIEQYSRYLEERVLLRYDSKEQIAYIRGVDEYFEKVNPIEEFIFLGEWSPEGNEAVV